MNRGIILYVQICINVQIPITLKDYIIYLVVFNNNNIESINPSTHNFLIQMKDIANT